MHVWITLSLFALLVVGWPGPGTVAGAHPGAAGSTAPVAPAGATPHRSGLQPGGQAASQEAMNATASRAVALPSPDSYVWPVVGPVLRSFEAPSGPYGPGHRGIDIRAAFGTRVVAAQAGVVAFAGWVGGSLFASIDHADRIRTTYSWLSAVFVSAGQEVARGQLIAATGRGHPEVAQPHLHFGARIGATYIDPMLLLGRGSLVGLIHLGPLVEPVPAA